MGMYPHEVVAQEVSLTGPAGTVIRLEGTSKAEGASLSGGEYGVKATAIFDDSTAGEYAIAFTKGTHGWQRRATRFTLPKAFQKIIVRVVYADQTGKAWVDALHLTAD